MAKNYLTDPDLTNKLTIEAYKRLSYDVKASHILVKIPEHEKDTAYAYSKILNLRKRLLSQSFESLKKEVHNGSTIIAEDLGDISPDVIKLREAFDFPSMKILQFAYPLSCDSNARFT